MTVVQRLQRGGTNGTKKENECRRDEKRALV